MTRPLVLWFKLIRPVVNSWNKIYYTARLNAKVKNMDFSVQCDGPVFVIGTGKISLGSRCRLGNDTQLTTMETGRIHIGNDTRINRGTTIVSYAEVTIDDFTIIGEYVTIRDANHGLDLSEPMRFQPHTSKPINIGRDVWIGRGVCILGGVTIGKGSVIGANSVVNKDIPPFSIAGGVPSRVIKTRA